MKQLHVNLEDLVQAMDDHSGGVEWFLDTQTGDVHPVTEDLRDMVDDDFEGGAGASDSEAKELELVRQIIDDDGERFVQVPAGDAHEAYRVMEDFIPHVREGRLRERLAAAIAGKGAFRRFKDALLNDPDVREEWFTFEAGVKRQWARDWLASIGIAAAADATPARDARRDGARPGSDYPEPVD